MTTTTQCIRVGIVNCGIKEINGLFTRIENAQEIEDLFQVDISYEKKLIPSFHLPRIIFYRKCKSDTQYILCPLIDLPHLQKTTTLPTYTWHLLRLASSSKGGKVKMTNHIVMYSHKVKSNITNTTTTTTTTTNFEKPPSNGWTPIAGITPVPVLAVISQQLSKGNSNKSNEQSQHQQRQPILILPNKSTQTNNNTSSLVKPEEKKDENDRDTTTKKNENTTQQKKFDVADHLCRDMNMVGHDQILCVTSDFLILERQWKISNLGPHDSLEIFLGCVGKVVDMDESDESVKLEWSDLACNWIPLRACAITWNKNVTKPDYSKDKDYEQGEIEQDTGLLQNLFGGV